MKSVINIKNLDCAHCAAELEEELLKIEGVISCSVSFVNQKISSEVENEGVIAKIKDVANNFEEVEVVEISEDRAKVIKIQNLHCANCAQALQEEIAQIEGVKDVIVDFLTQKIILDATDEAVKKAINRANKFEKVKVISEEQPKKEDGKLTEIIQIAVSAFALILAIVFEAALNIPWCAYILYAVSYLSVGYPVLISTVKNLAKGKIFDENFLMTVASVGAMFLGEYTEGVAVMLLYQIGEFLQGVAVGSSRRSITQIMSLKSEYANLIVGGEVKRAEPEELKIGDRILVKAGEKFPVDVKIISGKSEIDTKCLTGESALRQVEEGDEVLSGCINASGAVEAEVLREYSSSAVAKILDLVENSTAQKAQTEKFITKFAKYYTPTVCVSAVAVAFLFPLLNMLFSGGAYLDYFAKWVHSALIFLVVSCPCALIISVPLTYFGGIGVSARNGILIKGATYLDSLVKAKTVVFDKTGTLTEGEFEIVEVKGENALNIACAMERASNHPLAKAFDGVSSPLKAENVKEIAGRGLVGEIDGKRALCGNVKLLRENGVEVSESASDNTAVYVALDDKYEGCILFDDKLRAEAKEVIEKLHNIGVNNLIMLSGDNESRAKKVAASLNLDGAEGGLLPDGKLSRVEQLRASLNGETLVYVGDGINDAPVMTVADCSFSMGKMGSAAAVEASDIVLVSDDLNGVYKSFLIAKRTRKLVVENIVFSIAVKVGFMVAGLFIPSFPLILAVFGDVGVMLLAVLNSLRINKKI